MDYRNKNYRKNDDQYFEDDNNLYYQNVQALTGSQIYRAYGVPPIQEAASHEEITLRHIDSHLSTFARNDNRHLSIGFHNVSNIITPKKQNRTSNEITSFGQGQAKKEQVGSQNNMQTSLQIIVQNQQQNSQQNLPQIRLPTQDSTNQNHQGLLNVQNQNIKQITTEEDVNDYQLEDSSKQHLGTNQQQQKQEKQVQQNNNSNKEIQSNMNGSTTIEKSPNTQQQQPQQNNQQSQNQQVNRCRSETLFSNQPIKIICPYCSKSILTQINYTPSCKTHLIAVGLGLFGFICGLCLIPYYFQDKFQTAIHSCPQCKKEIGRCEY